LELVHARYKRANFESDQGHGRSMGPEATEVLYKMLETTPSQLEEEVVYGLTDQGLVSTELSAGRQLFGDET